MKIADLFSPSTRYFFKEADRTTDLGFKEKLHGYIYGRWLYLYIAIGTGEHWLCKIFKPIASLFGKFVKKDSVAEKNTPSFADTYHGKVVTTKSARQLVTLNRKIELRDLEQVIPYLRARDIVLKNPQSIVALECPCRTARKTPCLPLDVCLIIGEPFVSFILEHQGAKAKRISGAQAEEILEQEHARGHVHHAFFKDAMLDRFYAICNCCSCCCGAIQAMKNGTPMLSSSGYVCKVDDEKCIQCGLCAKVCQFNAIEARKKRPVKIGEEACMGCGACLGKCKPEALHLEKDPAKGEPLEIHKLLEEARKSTKSDR